MAVQGIRRDGSPGIIYWQADTADARGNVTKAHLGNGIDTVRGYDLATGFLAGITSDAGSVSIQKHAV